MPLGAQRSDVLKLVPRQAMILVFVGVGIGLLVSWPLTRLMKEPAIQRQRYRPVHIRQHRRPKDLNCSARVPDSGDVSNENRSVSGVEIRVKTPPPGREKSPVLKCFSS
jgi:hypothetical protein